MGIHASANPSIGVTVKSSWIIDRWLEQSFDDEDELPVEQQQERGMRSQRAGSYSSLSSWGGNEADVESNAGSVHGYGAISRGKGRALELFYDDDSGKRLSSSYSMGVANCYPEDEGYLSPQVASAALPSEPTPAIAVEQAKKMGLAGVMGVMHEGKPYPQSAPSSSLGKK